MVQVLGMRRSTPPNRVRLEIGTVFIEENLAESVAKLLRRSWKARISKAQDAELCESVGDVSVACAMKVAVNRQAYPGGIEKLNDITSQKHETDDGAGTVELFRALPSHWGTLTRKKRYRARAKFPAGCNTSSAKG